MHGLPHEHLDGFQIDVPCLAAIREDLADQAIYFVRRFLLDGFERFFSCSDNVSGSTGRK
jgi:hypothetical protein